MPDPVRSPSPIPTPRGPYLVEATLSRCATTPFVAYRDVFASPELALPALAIAADTLSNELVAMPHAISVTSRRVQYEHLAGDLEEDWSDYSDEALLDAWRKRFGVGRTDG